MKRLWFLGKPRGGLLLILAFGFCLLTHSAFGLAGERASGEGTGATVLEDFGQPDGDGFPVGWEGSRSTITAKETYTIQIEDGTHFLQAKGANQRVYTKKISWDPKVQPILKWRWRVRSIPEDADLVAAVFANLDTDLVFIPVSTKYVWSARKNKGVTTDGGFFSPTEVVIRSGRQPVGEWIEEEVNAYEDFKQIHQHEPAPQAWGISLLGGPGVEIDFGTLEVSGP